MLEMAIRRDPRSGWLFDQYTNLGIAMLVLDRNEESICWQKRALATVSPTYTSVRAQYHIRLAAAYARLGRLDEAHHALDEANQLWPYDTVRSHAPPDPSSTVVAGQVEQYQAALRLAGHRDHASEEGDAGVAADSNLRAEMAGLTPMSVPEVRNDPHSRASAIARSGQAGGHRPAIVFVGAVDPWRHRAGECRLRREHLGHGAGPAGQEDEVADERRPRRPSLPSVGTRSASMGVISPFGSWRSATQMSFGIGVADEAWEVNGCRRPRSMCRKVVNIPTRRRGEHRNSRCRDPDDDTATAEVTITPDLVRSRRSGKEPVAAGVGARLLENPHRQLHPGLSRLWSARLENVCVSLWRPELRRPAPVFRSVGSRANAAS